VSSVTGEAVSLDDMHLNEWAMTRETTVVRF
jgi:hypothetical protein